MRIGALPEWCQIRYYRVKQKARPKAGAKNQFLLIIFVALLMAVHLSSKFLADRKSCKLQ